MTLYINPFGQATDQKIENTHKSTASTSRRRFLQYGLGAATSLILPNAFASAVVGEPGYDIADRKLSLLNLHTGESITASYWAEGEYQTGELEAISRVLRDHRTGEIYPMDNQLLELLNTLHQNVGGKKPFHIISGYRSPKTNAALNKKSSGVAKRSLHMQGRAIDLRLPGCDIATLHKAARSCQTGGVGYYPKSNFIHVDTGRVRYWS